MPLYAKLSAAHPDVAEVARAVAAAGADGLSLINTLRGLTLDGHLRPVLARGSGGLSGPALKPVALHTVTVCHEATGLPIVGMGGVCTGRDALEFAACGAGDVAVGTVLFTDPGAPARVRAELGRHVRDGQLIIVKSTVPPGTTRSLVLPLLQRDTGGNLADILENTAKLIGQGPEKSGVFAKPSADGQ